MQNKPRSPHQIAQTKVQKENTSLSLNKQNLDIIKDHAKSVGITVSEIIDEAIAFYLANINNGNNTGNPDQQ